jgi:hypothetical protein
MVMIKFELTTFTVELQFDYLNGIVKESWSLDPPTQECMG